MENSQIFKNFSIYDALFKPLSEADMETQEALQSESLFFFLTRSLTLVLKNVEHLIKKFVITLHNLIQYSRNLVSLVLLGIWRMAFRQYYMIFTTNDMYQAVRALFQNSDCLCRSSQWIQVACDTKWSGICSACVLGSWPWAFFKAVQSNSKYREIFDWWFECVTL